MTVDAPPVLSLAGALHRHPNGAGVGPIDLSVDPGVATRGPTSRA